MNLVAQQVKQCQRCGLVFPPSTLHCNSCGSPLLLVQIPDPIPGPSHPSPSGPKDAFEWKLSAFWHWVGSVVSVVLLWWSIQYAVGLGLAYHSMMGTNAEGFFSWLVSRLFWWDCIAIAAGGVGLSYCIVRLRRLYTYDYRGVGNFQTAVSVALGVAALIILSDRFVNIVPPTKPSFSPSNPGSPSSSPSSNTYSLRDLKSGMSPLDVENLLGPPSNQEDADCNNGPCRTRFYAVAEGDVLVTFALPSDELEAYTAPNGQHGP